MQKGSVIVSRNKLRGTGSVHYLFNNQSIPDETVKKDLLARIGELAVLAEQGQIDNLMVACFSTGEDSHVLTGYSNLSLPERMTLVGYLQTDTVVKTVEANGGESHGY